MYKYICNIKYIYKYTHMCVCVCTLAFLCSYRLNLCLPGWWSSPLSPGVRPTYPISGPL